MQRRLLSTPDSNQIVTSASDAENEISEQPFPENSSSTAKPTVPSALASGKIGTETSDSEITSTRMQETANGSKPASEAKQQTVSSRTGSMPKRSPLTAREKLRAARVLGKYTESKPSKSELGSKVLDAMREKVMEGKQDLAYHRLQQIFSMTANVDCQNKVGHLIFLEAMIF